jgi:hypothetical protein
MKSILEMIQSSVDRNVTAAPADTTVRHPSPAKPHDAVCAPCQNATCVCGKCQGRDTKKSCHRSHRGMGEYYGGCGWNDNATTCYSFKGV